MHISCCTFISNFFENLSKVHVFSKYFDHLLSWGTLMLSMPWRKYFILVFYECFISNLNICVSYIKDDIYRIHLKKLVSFRSQNLTMNIRTIKLYALLSTIDKSILEMKFLRPGTNKLFKINLSCWLVVQNWW